MEDLTNHNVECLVINERMENIYIYMFEGEIFWDETLLKKLMCMGLTSLH